MTPDGWHSLRLSRPLFLGFVSQQSATMRVSHSARFEAVTRLKNLLHIVVAVQAKRNMLRFQKGNLEFRNSLGFRRVGTSALDSSHTYLHLSSWSLLIHQHRTALTVRIVTKTTPAPLPGFEHQSSLHRIAMQIRFRSLHATRSQKRHGRDKLQAIDITEKYGKAANRILMTTISSEHRTHK